MDKISFVGLFLTITFALFSEVTVQGKEFTIGVLLDSTLPDYIEDRGAIELALEELNNIAGNIDTFSIEIADVGTTPALEAVKHLHNNKDVKIFLGPITSGELSETIDYINEKDLLAISPTSTSNELAAPDNVFRVCANDSVEGLLLVQQAYLVANPAVFPEIQFSVFVIYRNDSYGSDLAGTILANWGDENSGPIIGSLSYNDPIDVSTFASAVNNMVSNSPLPTESMIFILISFDEWAPLMVEMITFPALQGTYIGSDGTSSLSSDEIPVEIKNYVALHPFGFSTVIFSYTFIPRFPLLTSNIQTAANLTRPIASTAYYCYDVMYIFGFTWFRARTDNVPFFKQEMFITLNLMNTETGLFYLNANGDRDTNTFVIITMNADGTFAAPFEVIDLC